MRFYIHEGKKAALQKEISRNKKSTKIISFLSVLVFCISVGGGGLYAALNLLIPSWGLEVINGVLQKNTEIIILTAILFAIPGLLIPVFLKVFSVNLASKDNAWRLEEKLEICEGVIRYAYRRKYCYSIYERYLFAIPINRIERAVWDPQTEGIYLYGRFPQAYYTDFRNTANRREALVNKIIIHDYFSPSLKDALYSNGVKFVK